jgi:hypothetical protein
MVAVSSDYLKATSRIVEDLVGKGLFEAFQNNPNDPNQTSGKTVRASLKHALNFKELHHLIAWRITYRNICKSSNIIRLAIILQNLHKGGTLKETHRNRCIANHVTKVCFAYPQGFASSPFLRSVISEKSIATVRVS